MRDVSIIGIGMTDVGEHWDSSLRQLAADAILAALKDANIDKADALYMGNAYGAAFSSQSYLGALVADHAGLKGIEAFAVDAADASGGAALRTGYLAVASGLVETAIVAGVEKSTDTIASARTEARNVSLDADYESIQGATLPALAGLMMRRYMHEYGVDVTAFEGFSINAHANGSRSKHAMFRNSVREGAFAKAPMVADPVNLFDGAPDADGAAALILTSAERASDLVSTPVKIAGSAVATDTLKIQDRADFLHLQAVAASVQKAVEQAGIAINDAHVYELHDSFTIMTTLALEAMALAERGQGWKLAQDGSIGLQGSVPISTFGGLKSRGNPVGATGVYQAVEAVLQLRQGAMQNQIAGANIALIQNIGGLGSTVITHVLKV